MKKLMIAFLAAVALCCSISVNATSKVLANIELKNGKEYENVEIKLPKGWDKKVNIKVNGQKMTFEADSIAGIVFWHINNPDNRQLICWHEYAIFNEKTGEYQADDKSLRKKGLFDKQWFTLHRHGEYVDLWVSFANIKADDKSITYSGSLDSPYFFHKKSDRLFVHVPFGRLRPGKTREWLTAFFADDEVLAETLEDKSELYDRSRKAAMRNGTVFTPFKYEDIVDSYVAGRKK